MDELAASVAQYMDEEAAKEDIEVVEPNATEEGASLPRAVPTDIAEASTPPAATGDTPPTPKVHQPIEGNQLTDPPSS